MIPQPQRILYVITKGNFGGAQRYVFELALAAKAAGHEVAVASAPDGSLVEKLHAANIPHLPVPEFQRDIKAFKEIAALGTLRTLYKTYQPTVVHLNSSKAGLLGSLAARMCRIPKIVFTAHGWPFNEKRSRLWRCMAWGGSYVTALCAHTIITVTHADATSTLMRGTHYKTHTIHTAVAEFSTYSRVEARNRIVSPQQQKEHLEDTWVVSVAELHPNKNLCTALEAIALHNADHTQKIFYTIIGSGEQHATLTEKIKALEITPWVHLAGHIDEARALLSAFDVMYIPSYKEGLPYVLLEAGVASLAVLASDVGGIPEVISDDTIGLLTHPDDVPKMVQHLHTLTDQVSRNRYQHALHNRVTSDFTLAEMITKTLALY